MYIYMYICVYIYIYIYIIKFSIPNLICFKNNCYAMGNLLCEGAVSIN